MSKEQLYNRVIEDGNKLIRCDWCEETKEDVKLIEYCNRYLCNSCLDIYNNGEDKTGYCSFDCIMSGRCDESC